MAPPITAPQNFPKPWWTPCRNPCADGRSSGVVLCARKEQQAAQTAAWVIPWTNSKGSTNQGQVINEMYRNLRQLQRRPAART